jgi:hypothetical protein
MGAQTALRTMSWTETTSLRIWRLVPLPTRSFSLVTGAGRWAGWYVVSIQSSTTCLGQRRSGHEAWAYPQHHPPVQVSLASVVGTTRAWSCCGTPKIVGAQAPTRSCGSSGALESALPTAARPSCLATIRHRAARCTRDGTSSIGPAHAAAAAASDIPALRTNEVPGPPTTAADCWPIGSTRQHPAVLVGRIGGLSTRTMPKPSRTCRLGQGSRLSPASIRRPVDEPCHSECHSPRRYSAYQEQTGWTTHPT